MRENADQEKLRIWTLFTQCTLLSLYEIFEYSYKVEGSDISNIKYLRISTLLWEQSTFIVRGQITISLLWKIGGISIHSNICDGAFFW